jgi:protein-tyrosine phosphatase
LAPVLARIGERLLAGGAPMLVHCTAGKERTGFAVAMLLHALGVPNEVIERDHLASRSWLHAPIHHAVIAKRLVDTVPADTIDEVVRPLLDVREVYLRAAMEVVTQDFGSREGYLQEAAGLDTARREHLRELALI